MRFYLAEVDVDGRYENFIYQSSYRAYSSANITDFYNEFIKKKGYCVFTLLSTRLMTNFEIKEFGL